jgi:vacuolar-type H+-ATPase subunit D/Vma8
MVDKMTTTDTKPTYASLKHKEEELLAQLKDLREEIAIAENGIVEEKLNTALQCLADVDKMTSSYYRCTIETYCEGCEENIEVDVDLAEIISALQQLR